MKSDAGEKGPVVLAVRDTVHNRHALRGASDIITTEFPIPMRTAVRALRSGLDPGGDTILVIRRGTAEARESG